MISKVTSAVYEGIDGRRVDVEADVSSGLPNFNIVGLAATTVVESKDRIKAAIINSGFEYPRGRVTVNLAPAGFRKNGSHLDLAIAMAILECEGYLDYNRTEQYGMIGELSLTGEVVKVNGVLPMMMALVNCGVRRVIVPNENYYEAVMAPGAEVIPVASIAECVELINDDRPWRRPPVPAKRNSEEGQIDFADIKGQENAKRAITIAVCGRHGLLMIGSPGCGKSMLASRIPTVMPEMSEQEMVDCTMIYSVAGKIDPAVGCIRTRPFRTPHSSISQAGLLGGGTYPVPGEITLAHNGVLFLDEVCEFKRKVIESLRVPLEEKYITHFRHGEAFRFPCNFLLIMAANPCMCGYYGDPEKPCTCTPTQIEAYQKKLSGPFRQRVDLEIRMEKVEYAQISDDYGKSLSSVEMRAAIDGARAFARGLGRTAPNADLTDREITEYCRLTSEDEAFMQIAYDRLHLSPRTYKRTLRIARTVADLDRSPQIQRKHLAEALNYRRGDAA